MMQFNVLIADDESAARRKLKAMLANYDEIVSIAEVSDGQAAIEFIQNNVPDVVFLDIQMPFVNGMDTALKTAHINYHLIFVTAFDEYALQAFDTHAIDYLVKPVRRHRLEKAIEKIKLHNNRCSAEKLQALSKSIEAHNNGEKIALKKGAACIVVNTADIGYVEMVEGYCRIHFTITGQQQHKTDTIFSDLTLEELNRLLPESDFIRNHRSYIVNVEQIIRYETKLRRVFILLKDFPEAIIPVARTKVPLIKKRWPIV